MQVHKNLIQIFIMKEESFDAKFNLATVKMVIYSEV